MENEAGGSRLALIPAGKFPAGRDDKFPVLLPAYYLSGPPLEDQNYPGIRPPLSMCPQHHKRYRFFRTIYAIISLERSILLGKRRLKNQTRGDKFHNQYMTAVAKGAA